MNGKPAARQIRKNNRVVMAMILFGYMNTGPIRNPGNGSMGHPIPDQHSANLIKGIVPGAAHPAHISLQGAGELIHK